MNQFLRKSILTMSEKNMSDSNSDSLLPENTFCFLLLCPIQVLQVCATLNQRCIFTMFCSTIMKYAMDRKACACHQLCVFSEKFDYTLLLGCLYLSNVSAKFTSRQVNLLSVVIFRVFFLN